MNSFIRIVIIALLSFSAFAQGANGCNKCCGKTGPCENPCPKPEMPKYAACPGCCENMGGIQYCDSSAGRFVCNNGYYSTCYCDRHAVMDLQKIKGCCLWQGGVMATDLTNGQVICNNGSASEICSKLNAIQNTAVQW